MVMPIWPTESPAVVLNGAVMRTYSSRRRADAAGLRVDLPRRGPAILAKKPAKKSVFPFFHGMTDRCRPRSRCGRPRPTGAAPADGGPQPWVRPAFDCIFTFIYFYPRNRGKHGPPARSAEHFAAASATIGRPAASLPMTDAPDNATPAPLTFRELDLPAGVLRALDDVGYESPSPIQA
ncbi:MAG TPA: hypothetical protein VM847_13190, partial [Tahibacter sp.]|nr:hypothetical protein [Tahibacter sp.]